jgi:hypothetical protein
MQTHRWRELASNYYMLEAGRSGISLSPGRAGF